MTPVPASMPASSQENPSENAVQSQMKSFPASSLEVSNAPPLYKSVEELTPYFGDFGGCFVAETLMQAHEQLAEEYVRASQDEGFRRELEYLGKNYIGRPTPLFFAERLTKKYGGAKIYLKREDLNHTGAHKINNAMAQCVLAKRLGKPRIICETGAGQHGVATATACALLGLDCTVYMGYKDTQRQSLNVFRIKTLGAKVVAVKSGSMTLKDAVNDALRDWVANVDTTHYCIGSAVGPHPFPTIVRDFQAIIGKETKAQVAKLQLESDPNISTEKLLPAAVIACVGGGSNAIGMFHPFIQDKSVRLIGVEAGGVNGVTERNEKVKNLSDDGSLHSSTLSAGTPGVFQGARTFILQDENGQSMRTSSISAGLDYAGVGPEHAHLHHTKRAEYVSVTNAQALEGFQVLCKEEGVIPALETSHAVYYTCQLAKELSPDQIVVVNISGRGDKDMLQVAKNLGVTLEGL